VKSQFLVLFDIDGVVHQEFAPQGRIVNKHFYTTFAMSPEKVTREMAC
jgi:hypothetical protein